MTYGPLFLPASPDHIPDIAVAVCKHGDNLHTAVFYRDDDERLLVLDLRIDGCINTEPASGDNRFAWAIPAIHPDLRASVRALCQALSKSPPEVYYALKYAPSEFFTEGESVGVNLCGDTVGFTCATFVLALFDSLGLSLLRHETWPVRYQDDTEEQRRLAQWASQCLPRSRPFGMAEHVTQKNASDVPCVRFRCHEVLASCTTKELPARFEEVERTGAKVLRWILATDARCHGQEPEA